MKVKVIQPFKDKVTGKVHNIGEEIDVTPERFEEIKKKGRYVAKVVDKKEEKKEPEKK